MIDVTPVDRTTDAELWRPSALGCTGPPGLLGSMMRDRRLRYAAVPRSVSQRDRLAGIDVLRRQRDGLPRIELSRRRGPCGLRDFLQVSTDLDLKCAVLDDWWFNVPRTGSPTRGWKAMWALLADELRATNVRAVVARVDRALDLALRRCSEQPFPRFETVDELMQRHGVRELR